MTLYGNPLLDPLAPSVTGADLALNVMEQQPTRVRKLIADLSLQNFILTRLFSSPGGLSGGAAIYDLVTTNDLYPDRDLKMMAPGTNVPTITSSRQAPMVAKAVEWAGRFDMTWTAIRRNDVTAFTNHSRRMSNLFVRKTNQYAINPAVAAISANSRTVTGHSWSAAIPPAPGQTSTPPANSPFGDIVACKRQADIEELGIVFNALLVNPNEYFSLFDYCGQDPGRISRRAGCHRHRRPRFIEPCSCWSSDPVCRRTVW